MWPESTDSATGRKGSKKPAGLQKAVKSRFDAGVELCEACVLVDEGAATARTRTVLCRAALWVCLRLFVFLCVYSRVGASLVCTPSHVCVSCWHPSGALVYIPINVLSLLCSH